MKKLVLILVLVIQGWFSNASIDIAYPSGGEKLPHNGWYYFRWTNSVPLQVRIYLQHYYDLNNNLLERYELAALGYFREGEDGAGVTLDRFPVGGYYKLQLRGTDLQGNVTSAESEYFQITAPVSLTGIVNSEDPPWTPGTKKTVTITWSGYEAGDEFRLHLLSKEQYIWEGYGFVSKRGAFPSESGTMTFDVDYPTPADATIINPYSIPTDGIHEFLLLTPKTHTRLWFGAPDLVASELRVRVDNPNSQTRMVLGEKIRALKVTLDARFATDDVVIPNFFLLHHSTTNIHMDAELVGETGEVWASRTVGQFPSDEKYDEVQFSFMPPRTIQRGTVVTLYVDCTVRDTSRTGTFNWSLSRDESTIRVASPSKVPQSVGIIFGFGNNIEVTAPVVAISSIDLVEMPTSPGLRAVNMIGTMKPNTSYAVEVTSDFRTWEVVGTVNAAPTSVLKEPSVATISNERYGEKAFFRLVEQP